MDQDFTLDDFRKQFEQLAKMDRQTVSRMPGMTEMIPEGEDPKVALKRIEGMIDAMTPEERRDPDRIDSAARHRIAAASGTQPYEVEQFLAQFAQVRALMRRMASMSLWQRIKMVVGLGSYPKRDDES